MNYPVGFAVPFSCAANVSGNVKVGEYTGARDLCCHVSVARKGLCGQKRRQSQSRFCPCFPSDRVCACSISRFRQCHRCAGEKLDMLFIQGGTGVNPEGEQP